MDYLVWSDETEPGHCSLDSTLIEEVERLHAGEPVPPDFGQPIEYAMDDLFPDDIVLSDNYEQSGQVIISSKLRAVLEATLRGHHLQFLPVTIRNHKGRVASRDYFILHTQDVCDCIDLKKSKVKWNPLNKQKIMSCKGLVIDSSAVPPDLALFRPKHWGARIVVSEPLAQKLLEHKFVGLSFIESSQYTGLD